MDIKPVLDRRAQVEAFQRKHRIGLLTLLFTDIVGSTKIKQSLGDSDGFDRIQDHHEAVRELLKMFPDGEEISTSGDSFFLVFAKPSEAVKFALLLQSRLRELAQSSATALFDRIGIHIGEVIIEERAGAAKPKDLYGMQVDICARVMSVGDGDQILMTRSAFDNARQVLKGKDAGLKNLVWLNHGAYVLSGVEEPLEICEVGEEGLARLRPPVDSEKVRRFVSAGGDRAPDAKTERHIGRWVAAIGVVLAAIVAIPFLRAKSSSVLDRIGFESAEGYTAGKSVVGQQGWKRGTWPGQLAAGGEGIAKDLFGGSSQQAFIGGVAGLKEPAVHASLARSLMYSPADGNGIVEIKWKQMIKPSSDGVGNLFNWLFYNQAGQFLCAITFDNSQHLIGRRFADNSFEMTPIAFKSGEVVDVSLRIDLAQNRWSATIGTASLPSMPLALDNRIANLGSMAVNWRSVARPGGGPVTGDNLIAFDDLIVTTLRE